LGEALWALGETAAAEEFLLRALQIRPLHFHALLFLGRLRMTQGNAPAAFQLFQVAASLSPENEIATTNAGICAAALGDLAMARRFLEMSVQNDSAVWLPHFYLGQIARAQGRMDAAREHLNAALQLEPNNPRIIEQLKLLPD
jgi:tetratricopeptide (TPR) repeat protein